MTVLRAKFKLDKIERTLGSRKLVSEPGKPDRYEPVELQTLVASPVYGGSNASDENKAFWQYTPSGSLNLSTVNAEAVAGLKLGGEFYLDITPVD